ncbi:MAG: TIGR02281 family clan AA aspartic protease [Nitrospirae bacterium]|nr:MAG: TIGR02281 family clan AA aspartic protease [Nitrospirota bacterium]
MSTFITLVHFQVSSLVKRMPIACVAYVLLSNSFIDWGWNSFARAALYRCHETSGAVVFTDSPAQLHQCTRLTPSQLNDSPSPGSPQQGSFPASSYSPSSPSQVPFPQGKNTPRGPGSQDAASRNPTSAFSIPLTKIGDSLIVSARLNETLDVQLVVDTGATMTVLSHEVAMKLGLLAHANTSVKTVQTAGGSIQVPMTTVAEVRIGSAVAHNVDVAIHDLPQGPRGVSGLLGMSFLRHFLVTVDSNRGVLHLQPHRETK